MNKWTKRFFWLLTTYGALGFVFAALLSLYLHFSRRPVYGGMPHMMSASLMNIGIFATACLQAIPMVGLLAALLIFTTKPAGNPLHWKVAIPGGIWWLLSTPCLVLGALYSFVILS